MSRGGLSFARGGACYSAQPPLIPSLNYPFLSRVLDAEEQGSKRDGYRKGIEGELS